MKIKNILLQEIRQMFITDRRRAIFLFGASLAYLILFALLYGTHMIKAVPIVIYDEDQSQFSRSLIECFEDSERFQIANYVTSQEDMENVLHEKNVYAALHIPKNFTRDTKNGHSSTILLMADGSNILITNTVTTAAQEIISAFVKETGARLTEVQNSQLPSMALTKVGPLDFRLRVLNNPTQSYLYFFVLGLSMAAFQQGVFLAVGASILSKYSPPAGTNNAQPLNIMAGKLLPYWLCATLAFFFTFLMAVYIFQIPGKAALTSLFLLTTSFIFAAIGLSALIASICHDELTFTRISIAYTVPAFVLSGYTWPQDAMDVVGKTLSYTFPLSYFANTVRELMIAGYSPLLYRNSILLLLIGAVCFLLAVPFYTRKLKQLDILSDKI